MHSGHSNPQTRMNSTHLKVCLTFGLPDFRICAVKLREVKFGSR
uniref:Uncharacterized protein n=1 Tax=Arundo donax TaxID=35708 RepID=A0A0A8ZBV0_ARUDO